MLATSAQRELSLHPWCSLRGVCAACGHHLERNSLSAEEHRKLFQHYDRQLTASVDSFENNRKDVEEVLMFRRMMNTETPPSAVVDGLNVVYCNQTKHNLVGFLLHGQGLAVVVL